MPNKNACCFSFLVFADFANLLRCVFAKSIRDLDRLIKKIKSAKEEAISVFSTNTNAQTTMSSQNEWATSRQYATTQEFLDLFDFGNFLQPPKGPNCHRPVLRPARLKTDGTRWVVKAVPKETFRPAEVFLCQNHPSVHRVSLAHTGEDFVYLVSRYIDGGDLWDVVHASKSPGQVESLEAVELMLQVLKCLEPVHKNNIAHLDIKLENFLVRYIDPRSTVGVSHAPTRLAPRREVLLTDFGLARKVGLRGVLFPSSWLVGTVGCISPEVCFRYAPVTTKCDIWAIGALFYRLLSGHTLGSRTGDPKPASDDDERAVCRAQLLAAAQPSTFDRLPSSLAPLIGACLHRDPTKRPTVLELSLALRPIKAKMIHRVENQAPPRVSLTDEADAQVFDRDRALTCTDHQQTARKVGNRKPGSQPLRRLPSVHSSNQRQHARQPMVAPIAA